VLLRRVPDRAALPTGRAAFPTDTLDPAEPFELAFTVDPFELELFEVVA
jgi:hypothetical protein